MVECKYKSLFRLDGNGTEFLPLNKADSTSATGTRHRNSDVETSPLRKHARTQAPPVALTKTVV